MGVAKDYLRESQNVWDIGANVGVFTFAAASLIGGGKVLAVEADIWLAQLLNRSNALNNGGGFDIRVIPAAISDRVGVAAFRIAARGRASNALSVVVGGSMMGGVREMQFVPTLTLDLLLRETFRPDFVKIDVEGAEKMVLDGAATLLREARPSFYIEVNSANTDAVTEMFRSHHYRMIDGGSREPIERCTFNTLAFPL
ncbi:MAG: FkbM family methyltransferase [Rhodopirellula sp.]|nr:FkbM family methyltransferase [Rhodopirellula sp.]